MQPTAANQRHDFVALGEHVLVALERLGDLFGGVEHARHRDVLVLHLDGHLAHHAVDLGEDAVELFLVGLELVPAGVGLGLEGLVLVGDERSHSEPPLSDFRRQLRTGAQQGAHVGNVTEGGCLTRKFFYLNSIYRTVVRYIV